MLHHMQHHFFMIPFGVFIFSAFHLYTLSSVYLL
ncbi:TPA: hypothetical protein GRI77_00420 [Vibrio parahaemolyticus]|nr:hypothetical protein DA442_07870 [Vibrio parahaemolyticus]EGQ8737329.1 hypothetical protein [Vibrio parahaemolyticus]EGQ8906818.1 hypothetical protein [Vibrio parahaemolyticus]EGQ9351592.1 hypothetical protein [Vibrio parahaemolyticus]EGQ9512858.1 hypothetical protein [Vibrio parahaemolyticus]